MIFKNITKNVTSNLLAIQLFINLKTYNLKTNSVEKVFVELNSTRQQNKKNILKIQKRKKKFYFQHLHYKSIITRIC